ncbi:MAG: LysM peptidoglycan-binding domain-containing protein [Bacilli bacterium]|nr:LysM peptidoglycan-binding domain-containing protein [Bacilli bacterium]
MYQLYEIMDNDTIDSLVEKIGTTKEELIRINGNFNFEKGNLIIVPNNNDIYYKYIVKSGDTLYGISKMYNQDINILYEINGIKEGDYIYPGEEIMILKNNVRGYITNENDTIKKVSDKMMIPIEEIIKNNQEIYLLPEQLIVHKES